LKKTTVLLVVSLSVCIFAVLILCKGEPGPNAAASSTSAIVSSSLARQMTGTSLPDCPKGPSGRGAGNCTRAEEGTRCQAHNPDMVLVCKSCFRLDERTAAYSVFVNPNCK